MFWIFWKAINNNFFPVGRPNLKSICEHTLFNTSDYSRFHESEGKVKGTPANVSRTNPPEWIKINTDGSVLQQDGGLGYIPLDATGSHRMGGLKVVKQKSAL